MTNRIDSSQRTHIAICGACGWRSQVYDAKMAARVALVRHEREQHPGVERASDMLRHARRRLA